MTNKIEISSKLLFKSIIQVIDNLTLPLVIQIRDKCNEVIILKSQPVVVEEPDEFKTWRVKPIPSYDQTIYAEGFGIYRSNTK